MTTKQRLLMALTLVSFLTVTGFVVGCDSDDSKDMTRDVQAGRDGGRCFELVRKEGEGRVPSNTCRSNSLNIGVKCAGEITIRRVLNYPASHVGSLQDMQCPGAVSSGEPSFLPCVAPAQPRLSDSGSGYTCHRT